MVIKSMALRVQELSHRGVRESTAESQGWKLARTYVLPRDRAVRIRAPWFSEVVGCSEVDRGTWSRFWSRRVMPVGREG